MSHIERGILGAGFYPAARGYTGVEPSGGVMLLGRDWGTVRQYEGFQGLPAKSESALAWRHTRDLYLTGLHGLPVWCTNYLMGARNQGSATGNIRKQMTPQEWSAFESSCWSFLHRQVILQAPKLIVIFGLDNQNDLAQANRLGLNRNEFFRYVFSCDGLQHSASLVYADHPHSLIARTAKLRAGKQIARMREFLEWSATL